MSFDHEKLWSRLAPLLNQAPSKLTFKLTVGFSGGLDSTVLLHALHRLYSSTDSFELSAIHINHRLQKSSDDWEKFCKDFCRQYEIPFQSICVDIFTQGKGLEAAAREARYKTFQNYLNEDDLLLTAHHLDDHIETLFLKLLRGTGIEGAQGIQAVSRIYGLNVFRPLLTFDRESLMNYALAEKITWIDDPSNLSDQFDRNYLRHNVLPLIEKRWPAYKETLHRFTENMIDANSVIHESITEAYQKVFDQQEHTLDLSRLSNYSAEKIKMILRHWISDAGFSAPSQKQLLQITKLIAARQDAKPMVEWGDANVRRFKDRLYIQLRGKSFDLRHYQWDLQLPLEIPGVGKLVAVESVGKGIKASELGDGVTIKFRAGGEVCKPSKRLHRHSFKKLLQEYNIPPWRREKIPLLYIGTEIAAVVNLFYCDPYAAKENEVGYEILLESI